MENNGVTVYHSDRGIDTLTDNIILLAGLLMLFGPMWWLNYVSDDNKRLGIITGFVFFFSVVLASATIAKPFEVLAGTAA